MQKFPGVVGTCVRRGYGKDNRGRPQELAVFLIFCTVERLPTARGREGLSLPGAA